MKKATKAKTVVAAQEQTSAPSKDDLARMITDIIGVTVSKDPICVKVLYWMLHVAPSFAPDLTGHKRKNDEGEEIVVPLTSDEIEARANQAMEPVTTVLALCNSLEPRAHNTLSMAYDHLKAVFSSTRTSKPLKPEHCHLCYMTVKPNDPRAKLHRFIPYHDDDYIRMATEIKRSTMPVATTPNIRVAPRQLYGGKRVVPYINS